MMMPDDTLAQSERLYFVASIKDQTNVHTQVQSRFCTHTVRHKGIAASRKFKTIYLKREVGPLEICLESIFCSLEKKISLYVCLNTIYCCYQNSAVTKTLLIIIVQ